MQIVDNLLTVNPYSRPGTAIGSIEGVVVHYVGNPGSSAAANRNYFENLKNQTSTYASSHYIIGLSGEVIRCVPESEVAYHASDANKHYIGIECCHPDSGGKFNDKTRASLVELAGDILARYGASVVKRHYDVTGKMCPLYYVNNPSAWTLLVSDIKAAASFVDVTFNGVTEALPAVNVNDRWIATASNLAARFGGEKVGVRAFLEMAGYKVDWKNGKVIVS